MRRQEPNSDSLLAEQFGIRDHNAEGNEVPEATAGIPVPGNEPLQPVDEQFQLALESVHPESSTSQQVPETQSHQYFMDKAYQFSEPPDPNL